MNRAASPNSIIQHSRSRCFRFGSHVVLLWFICYPSFSLSAEPQPAFRHPENPAQLKFPRAHASHPEFRIEWWYITGHLYSETGRRFGLQITFFRNAGKPQAEDSDFGSTQIFLAHMAVTDLETGAFYHQERLNREGWNAGASTESMDLYNGNWTLRATEFNDRGDPTSIRVNGSIHTDVSFELAFQPTKGRVLFGNNGYSQKGPNPNAASYYITFPRLQVEGKLSLPGGSFAVTGQAWMDHEISSNQLSDEQVGWDWVQMQLFDGTEVMAYRLRRKDGSTDPYSFFNWIDKTGGITTVSPDAFEWIPNGYWQSPNTGGSYPIRPILKAKHPVTGKTHTYYVIPRQEEQELEGNLGGISYWEGALDIQNEVGEVIGVGYLELTGYAQDLSTRL